MDMFLWITPIPPARAIAIAISDSVTVSIAAETRGMLSGIPRVKREPVATSFGWVVEWRGARRTSSNVKALGARTREAPLACGCSMREGPPSG